MSRFERQTILPGFGQEGQQKLKAARVLVVGAGGLGCPALLHLAAAGVGTLGIADGDNISESNLNRQTLFGHQHIGKHKAETAGELLKEKYPDVNFNVISEFLNNSNAIEILRDYDLVLDGSDNFGTRYMMNDACVLLDKPLVMGAIYQYEGQVTVFNYGENPVNYRDMYPNAPQPHEVPNCSETGVLGVLPGLIGTLQATEAIKIISGIGKVLTNKVLFYNLKTSGFFEVAVAPNSDLKKELPASEEVFRSKDYNITCGLSESIDWKKALDWKHSLKSCVLVDIRELEEEPVFERVDISKIPMSVLNQDQDKVRSFENIILFCKSGKRSEHMAAELKKQFPEKKVFSVDGGIMHPASPVNSEEK
ncbi:ThiF family adenylyltransferase [Salinimicrobium sediminilitoris]|uniref:ThiF family adenylyltransferase n=1 Tax=Salinimicrobium sediminilitoris TaxID=2876715 RepID=UPI001E626507|nr:HesA/MoeB/ThiF family protein [Salinimicrobium sediminilitoris]MCC8358358.1 HesA/MoeB/ThiF family protein [Salinimicrobium sediminilitoris]